MGASFEERSVWIQLSGVGITLGGYLAVAAGMLVQGVSALTPYVALLGVVIVLMVIWHAVGHAVVALLERPEPPDERDQLIGWRAAANSSWLLAVGVFGAMTALVFRVEGVWVAHLLLVSMFVSELARLALGLLYYQRGI